MILVLPALEDDLFALNHLTKFDKSVLFSREHHLRIYNIMVSSAKWCTFQCIIELLIYITDIYQISIARS